MSILSDLTGGLFENKDNKIIDNSKYKIFIKFDEDEPLILYDNVDKKNVITFTLQQNEDKDKTYIQFSCLKTGKKFKIYAE